MSRGDVRGAPASRCPTCGQPVRWRGNAARPFCSITCKLIDLGQWLDERYRVPTEPRGDPAHSAPPADREA